MRKLMKNDDNQRVVCSSSRLEEYLEILFLQIRDLSILNTGDDEQGEFYLIAWLDQDRKDIQRTEVTLLFDCVLFHPS